DSTAVALPYWAGAIVAALVPASALGRTCRRKRAQRPLAAKSLRRRDVVFERGFALCAAMSGLCLVMALGGCCVSRWATLGMDDSQRHTADVDGSFSCTTFYVESVFLFRNGIQIIYYAPQLPPAAPWHQDGRSIRIGWGGSCDAIALYRPV